MLSTFNRCLLIAKMSHCSDNVRTRASTDVCSAVWVQVTTLQTSRNTEKQSSSNLDQSMFRSSLIFSFWSILLLGMNCFKICLSNSVCQILCEICLSNSVCQFAVQTIYCCAPTVQRFFWMGSRHWIWMHAPDTSLVQEKPKFLVAQALPSIFYVGAIFGTVCNCCHKHASNDKFTAGGGG